MTDSIIWSPRIGSSGDDRYKWNANLPFLLTAGESDYSNPPTQVEINDRSGVNQLFAEVRKRYYQREGSTTTTPPYVAAGDRVHAHVIKGSYWTALQESINRLRLREDIFSDGGTSFTFTNAPAIGDEVKHIDWWEVRKALAIATQGYPLKILSANINTRVRVFNTSGVLVSDIESLSSGFGYVGHVWTYFSPSPNYNRQHNEYRALISVQVPAGLENYISALLWTRVSTINTVNAYNIELYVSNSDDSSPTSADAYNTDNLCDSIASTGFTIGSTKANIQANEFDIPISNITNRMGTVMSFILKSNQDILSPPGYKGATTEQDRVGFYGASVPAFDTMINY